MKHYALLAGVALLAACSQKDEAAPAATESAAASVAAATGPVAGKYDVTNPDGTKIVTELKADGTYTDWDGDKAVEKGSWAVKDGKTCFDAEGDQAEVCYTDGPAAADGSFDATGPDGKVTKVKPQA